MTPANPEHAAAVGPPAPASGGAAAPDNAEGRHDAKLQRWCFLAGALLVFVVGVSKMSRCSSTIETKLLAERVTFTVGEPLEAWAVINEKAPVRAVFAQFLGSAEISNVRLQPIAGAQIDELDITEPKKLTIQCQNASLQPSLVFSPADSGSTSLMLLPIKVKAQDQVAVTTPASGASVALNISSEVTNQAIVATLTSNDPYEIVAQHCTATLATKEIDLSRYRIVPREEVADITIKASRRLNLDLDYRELPAPQLLKHGPLRISKIDLSAEHPTALRGSSLLADGELSYPDYPTLAAIRILERDNVKFERLGEFWIERMSITSVAPAASAVAQQPAIRLQLLGNAGEIRERRGTRNVRDLRLSAFDRFVHTDWMRDSAWILTAVLSVLGAWFTIFPRK